MKIKRKHKKRIYAAITAIFVLLTVSSVLSCDKNTGDTDGSEKQSETAEATSGKLPAVYCDGKLYISDGYGSYGGIDLLPEGFEKYGEIASERTDGELPGEELESRGVAVGDVVYASADNAYAIYVVTDDVIFRYLTATSFY